MCKADRRPEMDRQNTSRKQWKSTPVKSKVPDFIQEGKKEFASYFGAKVDVKVAQKGNGKLIIPFSSEEDFKRLKKLISGAE